VEKIHIGIIGVIAGACTTLSFIPQVVKIVRTRHARDISLYMYLILTAGVLLWLIYGILIGEFPVILANSVTLVLCLAVLVMKMRFSKGGK